MTTPTVVPVEAPEPDDTTMPVGIPLWPGLTIASELVTILSVAAANVIGVVGAGITAVGLTAAVAAAAAGKRYRAARARSAAARGTSARPGASSGIGLPGKGRSGSGTGGAGKRRSGSALGLPGLGSSKGTGKGSGRAAGKGSGRKSGAPGGGRIGGALGKLTGRGKSPAGSAEGKGKSSGKGPSGGSGKTLGKGLFGRRNTSKPTGTSNSQTGGRASRKAMGIARTGREKPFSLSTPPARPTPPKSGVANTVRRPGTPVTGAVPPKAPVPAPAPRPSSTAPAPRPAQLVTAASYTTGGTAMPMKLGWIEASEEMLARANAWHVGPGEMTEAANQFAKESDQAAANFAKALDIISRKMCQEQPLNKALPEIVASGSKAMRAVGNALAPFGRAFSRLHAREIQRQQEPRPNEKAWNPQP